MGVVYIVASHQIEARKITDLLTDLKHVNPLEFEYLRPQQLADKIEEGIELIVFSNPKVLNLDMKHQIGNWRKRGLLAPVLLISRISGESDIDDLESLNNFVLLEKPYVDKDLKGIAQKLLNQPLVYQRKFRRFSTNQAVELTSYKSDYKSNVKVHNISMGGVCIEGACEALQVGELLHMNFHLDRLNTERMMCGRVVWVQAGTNPSAGVEFVKDKEVYGQLMKTIA